MQGDQNGKEPEEEEVLGELEGVNEALIRKHQLPLSAQSAFSYIPPRHKDPPELSYFYQEILHRCDREHAKSRGLHINDEEKKRPVAILSSSEYGRHINKPVEQLIRDYVRINHVKAEFYRKNGIACLVEK
ncbi:PREDICTED: uncharacterized protein C5orf49 homolog [Thamnophis sirtalis]|uniref:Uncharacterized protein C5orf49 homolog n=1 Tax=Thamnophis sirtalis TaxID=35019 RepID=A0A6I9YH97_9SAUR|nr:PREDICTED: uncharacterized protein C5orf49 homolog [Thamnophis sirtalis]